MEAQFWIKAWNDGRTAFHQQNYHEKLTEFFPELGPQPGQSVLVPLCGKSKDLLWLSGLGLRVHGVELHTDAVEAFFAENKLEPVSRTQDQNFKHYAHKDITVSCGDFFKLDADHSYDFIYDRAALVALPAPMRKDYAQVITRALKPQGKYLLIVYEYDQLKMEGPPFSVPADEIQELYAGEFSIKLLEGMLPVNDGPRLTAIAGLLQKVYILEKKR